MKPGLSARIAWSLAAQETVKGDYEYIRPDHLFLGTLKFAELELRHIERRVHGRTTRTTLMSERNALRDKLSELFVEVPDDSTDIRYALRMRLGRGRGFRHALQKGFGKGGRQTHDNDKRVVHRSDTSRDICKKAEVAARNSGRHEWVASHLLEALLENPTSEMAEVFAEIDILAFHGDVAKKTPYLDRFGKDLSAEAAAQHHRDTEMSTSGLLADPVLKVIIEDLVEADGKNVLLIQKGKRSAKDLVLRIAGYGIHASAPRGLRRKRFVELDVTKCLWRMSKCGNRTMENMDLLVEEIMETENVILFLNNLHRFLDPGAEVCLPETMESLLAHPGLQCIAGTDEEHFRGAVRKDRRWKRVFRPVWIHDLDFETPPQKSMGG